MDYELLRLTDGVPLINRSLKKEQTTKKMKEFIRGRDKVCRVCGEDGNKKYPRLHVHHIIPNGPATEGNLILLCEYCHDFVGNMLKKKGYNKMPFWKRREHNYV